MNPNQPTPTPFLRPVDVSKGVHNPNTRSIWKPRTPDQREKRRIYQAALRARRRAAGLTSKGTPLKDPNHYMRRRPSTTKTAGHKWSPEQHRKFRASMKEVWRKKREHQAAPLNDTNSDTPPQPQQTLFSLGDAANAVMTAARVLQAVTVGLQIT